MILKRPGIQYVPVQRGEYMCKIPGIKVEVQQVFNKSKVLEKTSYKSIYDESWEALVVDADLSKSENIDRQPSSSLNL